MANTALYLYFNNGQYISFTTQYFTWTLLGNGAWEMTTTAGTKVYFAAGTWTKAEELLY